MGCWLCRLCVPRHKAYEQLHEEETKTGTTGACWSKQNQNEQRILHETQHRFLLIRNADRLTDTVQMDGLWVHLYMLDVLNKKQEARLKENKTNYRQVGELLDFLLCNPTWRFHAFVRALCLDDQEHVVSQILGLDPATYNVNQYQEAQPSNPQNDEELAQLQKVISSQKDYNIRTLMKCYQLDIEGGLDRMYDMNPCYIDITVSSDDMERHSEDIDLTKLLDFEPGMPHLKTILLSGPAGGGKSSKVRKFAYTWSENTDSGQKWDLVVILNVSTLRITESKSRDDQVMEAISQSLEGVKEKDREVIIKGILDEALRVLVIPDGLDECKHPATLKMLEHLIEKTHKTGYNMTVLATCRTGECSVPVKFFDRMIKLNGFTVDEGLTYIRLYFTCTQNTANDALIRKVTSLKEELHDILVNPLMVHILSVVTANGTLELEGLTIKKLLRAFEKLMKRRQLVKNKKAQMYASEISTDMLNSQANKFYMLCLYVLLSGQNDIDGQLLEKFGIGPDNLYFTFMSARKVFKDDFDIVHVWNFTHNVFLEYLASCGLEMLSDDVLAVLLLILCRRKGFRNTQKILFSALGGDPKHTTKLTDVIRTTLLLQFDWQRCSSLNGRMKDLMKSLRKEVDDLVRDQDLDILMLCQQGAGISDCAKQRLSLAQVIFEKIRACYEEKSEEFQNFGLLVSMAHDQDLMKHVYGCLHEVSKCQQEQIFQQSIRYLLPSKCTSENGTSCILYATGGIRWSAVGENKNGIYVHAWCPEDGCEAINMHDTNSFRAANREVRKASRLQLCVPARNIGPCMSSDPEQLWGPTPDTKLKSLHWIHLLRSIPQNLHVTSDILSLEVLRSTPLADFLKCLLDEANFVFFNMNNRWKKVNIKCGKIMISDLEKWLHDYRLQKAIEVVFSDLHCLTTEGATDEEEERERRVMQSIRHSSRRGPRIFTSVQMGTPRRRTPLSDPYLMPLC